MIVNSARDIKTPGVDNYSGCGMIDIASALAADPEFWIESRIHSVGATKTDNGTVVRVVGTGDADEFGSAGIIIGQGETPEKWLRVRQQITSPVRDDVLIDIPAAALRSGKVWWIRLVTTHNDGTTRESRFMITLG
jgi:hypothetical protein